MDGFFDGLEQSLQNRNWYSALVMSLTLPDICAKSAYPDKTSGKRYAAWFDQHLGPTYTSPVGHGHDATVFLSGGECYALRCALLHEGSTDITKKSARQALERFHFCAPGSKNNRYHRNQVDDALVLMVDEFAADVLKAARAWWSSLDADQRRSAQKKTLILLDTDTMTGI